MSSLLHKGFPLVAVDRGYSLIAMHGLLIVVPSLVVEHQLSDAQAQWLWHTGLVALWHVGSRASQVAQCLKKLLAVQEMWVHFLGWEDPLK